jgi:chaperonin GroEL (HSP60 family)
VAAITLGPMGRNVIIENDKHLPRITKDGVTVVKHIEYVEVKARRRTGFKMQSVPSSKSQSTVPTSSQVTAPPPPLF